MFVTLDSPHNRLKISGVEIRLRELGRKIDVGIIHRLTKLIFDKIVYGSSWKEIVSTYNGFTSAVNS